MAHAELKNLHNSHKSVRFSIRNHRWKVLRTSALTLNYQIWACQITSAFIKDYMVHQVLPLEVLVHLPLTMLDFQLSKEKKHICFENTQHRSPTIHIWCRIYHCHPRYPKTGSDLADPTSSSWCILEVHEIPLTCTVNRFWTWWPLPWTYDLDLLTWPRYPSTWPPCQNSSLYVPSFFRDSETDTHTHTQCQNYDTLRWRWV